MIKKILIYTESKFLPEKNYVFHVLFHEILDVEYEVYDTSVHQVYKFVLPNKSYIEIRDVFFSNIPESIGYCQEKYLPQNVITLKNVIQDEVIPFFYGSSIYTPQTSSVYCGGDVIGSAFFMLSRWEELMTSTYDKWERFPEKQACAVKFGTIKKPVVQMYAELLRTMFAQYGLTIKNEHVYAKVLSHDVDYLYKWGKNIDFLKSCLGDLFRRLSFRNFQTSVSMHRKNVDPYDVYRYLMDLSERNGVKSTFYFLYTKANEVKLTSEKGKQIIDEILARKHNIGIHSNYYLEKDFEKVQSDLAFYEHFFNRKLTLNRQHFLKVRMPETLSMLEKCGIQQDSSLYYSHNPGFRTGMCMEHSLFDCKKRKMLNIKELPLTLMDVSLQDARKYDEAIEWVDDLFREVKKYQGTFVCLWHNSSFNAMEWKYLDGVYEYIVNA